MAKALFAIRDGSRRKAKPCAFLSYSDEEGFSIAIEPHVSSSEVPAFFVPFVKRGDYYLSPELSLRWVRERVPPPSRQNLGEILKAHGLSEYNELALLRSGRGESSQDSFVVEEVNNDITGSHAISDPTKRREELGAEIKARRIGLGMSQRELAEAIGIDQPALSRIEAGESNITFDILSSIDQVVSNEDRPILNRTLHTLWNKQRRGIRNKLNSHAHELGQTYSRLINELETYDESNQSAVTDSRVISHCFRELMNSFPAYVDAFTISGMQGLEKQALDNLFTLLERQPALLGNPDAITAMSPELREALAKLHEAHLEGSTTNKHKMRVSVSGLKTNEAAPISAWEKAQKLAIQTAHLPRRESARIPSFEEYTENLTILENSIETRIGDIYEVKRALFELIDKANRVDAAGKFRAPRPEDVDGFISSIGDSGLQSLAFQELKNPRWLEALEDANFFDSYLTLDSRSSAPLYPAPFLSECLKYDRQRVINLLKPMSEKGWESARSFMVKTAINLPDHELEAISCEIIKWAKEGYGKGTYFWVRCGVDTLILRMLESGSPQLLKDGQKLFQQLVQLRKHDIDEYPYAEISSCIPDYSYAQFVHNLMQPLPLKTRFVISQNMLNQYMKPPDKNKHPMSSRYTVYSLKPDDLERIGFHKKLLIPWIVEHKKAVRDALQDNSENTLHKVLEQKPLVLRCIMSSLHEHIQSIGNKTIGSTAQNVLAEICLDGEILFEYDYEMEIIPLLSDFASHATDDERERFLYSLMGWLDSWEKTKLRESPFNGIEIIAQEKRRLEHSILSSFPRESLPSRLLKKRIELDGEIGIYDGPRELYKVTTITGPNSPLTVKDLMQKGPDQALKWLQNWNPSKQDRLAFIEHEGVANMLASLIEEDPTFFVRHISTLKKLKPVYLMGILAGWQNAIKSNQDVPIKDAIEICSLVLSLDGKDSTNISSGYGLESEEMQAAMQRIGWLIVEILESENTKLNKKAMHDVLSILIDLRERALASPEQNSAWSKEEDCINGSVNTISSVALSGIIQWVLSDGVKKPEEIENAWDMLNKALPDSDCSTADIAAFALKMSGLIANQQDWLETRYGRLFGMDMPSNNQRLFLAVQVSTGTMHLNQFEFLRKALETSIEVGMERYPSIMGMGRLSSYAESLGYNLFQLYLTNKIDIVDALLQWWLENADPQAIGSALEEICYQVSNSLRTTDEIAYRIQLLWDYLANKSNTQGGVLRGAFRLASSHLYDHDWLRKALLEESKSHDSTLEMDLFFDDVHILASENPEWGIALLRSVIENDVEKNKFMYGTIPHSLIGLFRAQFGKQDDHDISYCMNELGRMGILDLDRI